MGNSHAGLEQSNLSLWFEDVFGKKKKEKMSLLALIIVLWTVSTVYLRNW